MTGSCQLNWRGTGPAGPARRRPASTLLRSIGWRKVKVMVGGAPVTEGYAREIGADGYASDASKAVALAKSLVG